MNARRGFVSLFVSGLVCLALVAIGAYSLGSRQGAAKYEHISAFAWDKEQWNQHTKGIRTSYNPDRDLNAETLTLVPGDERWLDFVYWCFNNKVAEHQVEAYGGTGWSGPTGGVIFHWAPGSRWETHTLASFGFTIGHIIGEHRWTDTMFPDFFEKYGGVHGVNVKDRLVEIDPNSPAPWVEFLEYCGGATSPLYRYLFHQEVLVDPVRERIYLLGGQGAGFEYSFERFYHEVREVLTDAKAFQFFQLYDMYGPGFASRGGWASKNLSPGARGVYFADDESKWACKPGVAKAEKYDPHPPAPEITGAIREADALRRGQKIFQRECAPCHGVRGDGAGFLAAGFVVRPRDFRQGRYKFRSTKDGQLPTIADLESVIRRGVPNTTMPAWGQFLTKEQIADVARYLVVFSERFLEAWNSDELPESIAISEPPADLGPLAARGAELYQWAQCHKCHGNGGKGDGEAARDQKDSWDYPIEVTDLTYKWLFKNGWEPRDTYRSLFAGLTGSSMPCSDQVIPDEHQRWALVAYVHSLSPEQRPALRLKDFKERYSQVVDTKGIIRR